jgi:hypothetical protein
MLHGSLQVGTTLPLDNQLVILKLLHQRLYPCRGNCNMQGCKLKGGNFLVESVTAAASWTTLSAPSQQQYLALGTQAFDPGSGQKVGFDH